MKYVSYLRVSTSKQGHSGLGIEAQRSAIKHHAGDSEPLQEYLEVESGRKSSRPELQKAIRYAVDRGAVLLVAKVDRLARSVSFLHQILDSGVDVRFCDLPQIEGPAGRFMLNQMAAVAELEADLISARTKAALQVAKERGTKLGNPNGTAALVRAQKGNTAAVAAKRYRANNFARAKLPIIREIRESGVTTLTGIASELNRQGVLPPRSGKWQATTVKRVIDACESIETS